MSLEWPFFAGSLKLPPGQQQLLSNLRKQIWNQVARANLLGKIAYWGQKNDATSIGGVGSPKSSSKQQQPQVSGPLHWSASPPRGLLVTGVVDFCSSSASPPALRVAAARPAFREPAHCRFGPPSTGSPPPTPVSRLRPLPQPGALRRHRRPRSTASPPHGGLTAATAANAHLRLHPRGPPVRPPPSPAPSSSSPAGVPIRLRCRRGHEALPTVSAAAWGSAAGSSSTPITHPAAGIRVPTSVPSGARRRRLLPPHAASPGTGAQLLFAASAGAAAAGETDPRGPPPPPTSRSPRTLAWLSLVVDLCSASLAIDLLLSFHLVHLRLDHPFKRPATTTPTTNHYRAHVYAIKLQLPLCRPLGLQCLRLLPVVHTSTGCCSAERCPTQHGFSVDELFAVASTSSHTYVVSSGHNVAPLVVFITIRASTTSSSTPVIVSHSGFSSSTSSIAIASPGYH
uniref:Uncharacterized protein n=1 Tax=Oryza punctata TaxID=4537 RepID=A0A0E0JH66_ORYPU